MRNLDFAQTHMLELFVIHHFEFKFFEIITVLLNIKYPTKNIGSCSGISTKGIGPRMLYAITDKHELVIIRKGGKSGH